MWSHHKTKSDLTTSGEAPRGGGAQLSPFTCILSHYKQKRTAASFIDRQSIRTCFIWLMNSGLGSTAATPFEEYAINLNTWIHEYYEKGHLKLASHIAV